ncbi:MAG: Bug family tripartite tricarboxylate transporter substrate binding protein [Betaproteobacteria bacterium]|jgi:tripartite-type tricarboxylate transporter receptor subunit TctC|nr:tripartite tricarboxylate transporter substrate binding protein [Betaproteobacteria bacterium]
MKNYKYMILLTFIFGVGAAQAQPFPNKAVRLVVPFAAGGSTDVIARILAPRMAEAWGQQVIVDNRPGGNTTIGTEIVARAAPDGHTLLVTPAPFTVVPSVMTKLPYDPVKDFEPILLINTTPMGLVVHPGVPAKNMNELIALAKKRPGQMNFGSSGNGGVPHLSGELLNTMAGLKILHVPYKGNAPALADLVGGHVDMVFNGLTSVIPLIRANRVRVLGVTSLARTAALPDVPTLDEQGLKGFQAVAWNGLSAPARTPKEAIVRIQETTARIVRSPELAEQLKRDGSDPVGSSTAEFQNHLRDEVVKWKRVLDRAGIKSF